MDEFYRDPSINGLTALYGQQQPQVAAGATEASGGDPLLFSEAKLEKILKCLCEKKLRERERVFLARRDVVLIVCVCKVKCCQM